MDLTDEQLAALRDGGRSVRPSRSQLLAELDEQGLDGEAEALASRPPESRPGTRRPGRPATAATVATTTTGTAAVATTEATTGTPLLDRLAELERAAEAAGAGVRERELELARARRAVDRAEAALAAYLEAVAAGEREPDDGELGRLEAALAAAESDVAVRHSDHWRTGPRVEVRHPRAEAALAGARRALERAEAERDGFAASEWRRLVGELRPADREATAAHEAAAARLEAARAGVVARRRLHARVAGYAGREPATGHLPETGAG